MSYGEIFKKKFKKDPRDLTIGEIEKLSIDEHKLQKLNGTYGNNLVSMRGNVFPMNDRDVDNDIDEFLRNPLI